MRTKLIFYKSINTQVNEKIVRSGLAKYGVVLGGTVSAGNPAELTRALSRAVQDSELILISGGLDSPGSDNTVRVLSRALGIPAEEAGRSRSVFILDTIRTLPQPSLQGSEVLYSRLGGADGLAMASGTQCIIALPGNEAQLSDMLGGSAAEFYSAIYGLTYINAGTGRLDEPAYELTAGEVGSMMERTLNLSEFASQIGEDEDEMPIEIHGRGISKNRQLLIRVGVAVAVLAVLITVFYIAFREVKEKEGEYTAKGIYNETRALYNAQAEGINLPEGVLPKLGALFEHNKDLKGWLAVPSSDIAFPVLQSTFPEREDFYADHDYNRESTEYGSLYLARGNTVAAEDTNRNYVVYGNKKSGGGAFAEINSYTDIDYFRAHPLIQFDTLYQDQMWRVFSVAVVSDDTAYDFNYEKTDFLLDSSIEQHLYQ
ncbi:MAG: sortase, partial [Oscillospiraceae bacterium]|nr:sortase [Oscillospiraceae bacterium]